MWVCVRWGCVDCVVWVLVVVSMVVLVVVVVAIVLAVVFMTVAFSFPAALGCGCHSRG